MDAVRLSQNSHAKREAAAAAAIDFFALAAAKHETNEALIKMGRNMSHIILTCFFPDN
jgi:hypothetical protein